MRGLPEWAPELLRTARVAHLATADAEGRPLVVPVCYVFDGEVLYTAVDAKPKRTRRLKRVKNLEANPRVSLVVDHYEEDWEALCYVLVQGRGELVTDASQLARAVKLLKDKYLQYRAMELDPRDTVVIRIVPEKVVPWAFRDTEDRGDPHGARP